MRAPTLADTRCGLEPDVVDGLAAAHHALHCAMVMSADAEPDDNHVDADRAKARFLLLILRDSGWKLVRDQ